jgi:hypothetical protein
MKTKAIEALIYKSIWHGSPKTKSRGHIGEENQEPITPLFKPASGWKKAEHNTASLAAGIHQYRLQ